MVLGTHLGREGEGMEVRMDLIQRVLTPLTESTIDHLMNNYVFVSPTTT